MSKACADRTTRLFISGAERHVDLLICWLDLPIKLIGLL